MTFWNIKVSLLKSLQFLLLVVIVLEVEQYLKLLRRIEEFEARELGKEENIEEVEEWNSFMEEFHTLQFVCQNLFFLTNFVNVFGLL